MSFVGIRRRTTEVLQKKMYKDDIVTWLSKADEHDGPTPNSRYFPHCSKSTKSLTIYLCNIYSDCYPKHGAAPAEAAAHDCTFQRNETHGIECRIVFYLF